MNKHQPLKGITFTGSPLDRLNNSRHNQSFVLQCLEDPNSQWILFFELKPLITSISRNQSEVGVLRRVAWKYRTSISSLIEEANKQKSTILLLGRIGTTYYCALELSYPFQSTEFEQYTELRPILPLLSPQDAALAGHARSLLEWHNRHKFCGRCGSSTYSTEGGSKRKCSNEPPLTNSQISNPKKAYCGLSHYPRTDPVVIMVVVSPDGQKCLLGRKPTYPQGYYSCLAGFMEPGESIEEAVCREVKEESNIDVDINTVVYVASQPWPFGGQIMIGCFARATSTQIQLNKEHVELEDVQWFSVDELREALEESPTTSHSLESKRLRIPPFTAIAHRMLVHWLNQKRSTNNSLQADNNK